MKPGIYRDFDVADYFADPCPQPSLSQSIAKILLDRSPLHAAQAHPRLTKPEADEEATEKYEKAKAIGDAAHALMIGRGKDLTIVEFDSWRSDKAKAAREDAEILGRTPILSKHYRTATMIAERARRQLAQHEECNCFLTGAGEVVLIWEEDGIWFRCLVDWLHNDLSGADDYKTTGMSVAEHVLGTRASDAGWHIQAAMIERGLNALDPAGKRSRLIRFVAQEQEPPYALNVMVMDHAWLTMGRKQLDVAVDIWRDCIESGKWPGYEPRAVTPPLPGWYESRWLNREIENAARARGPHLNNILAAG